MNVKRKAIKGRRIKIGGSKVILQYPAYDLTTHKEVIDRLTEALDKDAEWIIIPDTIKVIVVPQNVK